MTKLRNNRDTREGSRGGTERRGREAQTGREEGHVWQGGGKASRVNRGERKSVGQGSGRNEGKVERKGLDGRERRKQSKVTGTHKFWKQ